MCDIEKRKLSAKALINGSDDYPDIHGYAAFVPTNMGTMVSISLFGLPKSEDCGCRFYAVHIHDGGKCSGNEEDAFANAGSHYNPKGCKHPCHAGDMPQLLADNGEAHLAFLTSRFTPAEVIGRTIIVHSRTDDMMSQPSGNSGEKIACGVIVLMV